jgi:MYXO-CTERM domain-containing protein
MVDVAVAKAVRATTEIELTRERDGEPADPADPASAGGCTAGGGPGMFAGLFALALIARRRRPSQS